MGSEPVNNSRPALLVIHVRPRPERRAWWPVAVRWPSLRCLVGWHPKTREMALVRGPDGTVRAPAVVRWTCGRCGRVLGETNLATLGLD